MNPYMGRNRHLVVHGDGIRHPLFWIQPGLQQATLLEKLGPDQPVYCVARPMMDRTKRPLTFDEIRAFHIETIRSLQPHGPYAFAGVYTSAVIAFEVASELRRQGESISALILINPDDPAVSRTELVREPPTFRWRRNFNRVLFHLGKIKNHSIQEKLTYCNQRIQSVVGRTKKSRARRAAEAAARSGTPAIPKLRVVYDADVYALQNHVLHPYAGSGTLLRPSIKPQLAYNYPNRRWHSLFLGGLDVQEVPGDSSSMWLEDNAAMVAQRIRSLCHLDSSYPVSAAQSRLNDRQ